MSDPQDNNQEQLPDDITNDENISDAERELILSGAPNPNDVSDDAEDDAEDALEGKPEPKDDDVDSAAIEQALSDDGEDEASASTEDLNPAAAGQDESPDFDNEIAGIKQQSDDLVVTRDDLLGRYDALGKRLDDGEIGNGEYNSEKLKIERQLTKIDRQFDDFEAQAKAIEAKAYQHVNAAQQLFSQAVNDFMARPENSVFAEGTQQWAILDQQVRLLGGTFGDTVTPAQLLQKARAATAAILDVPALPTSTNTPKSAKPTQPKVNLPPTLGDMDSFENNQVSTGEFDHIFRLKGAAFDDAIASLTDDDFKRATKALKTRIGR